MKFSESLVKEIPEEYKIFTDLDTNDLLDVTESLGVCKFNSQREAFFQIIERGIYTEFALECYGNTIYVLSDRNQNSDFVNRVTMFINDSVRNESSAIWIVEAVTESKDHYILPYYDHNPIISEIYKACVLEIAYEVADVGYYGDQIMADLLEDNAINIGHEYWIDDFVNLIDTLDVDKFEFNIEFNVFKTYKYQM